MASPSQQLSLVLQLCRASLRFHLSQANKHIAHLNRLLASTSHLDSLLSALYYTLTFLASFPPLPASIPISFRPLAGLISTLRTTLRLFGLLRIYTWALSVYASSSQSDRVLRFITWTQVAANVVYQGLENGAFLAHHGVLRGWSVERRRWWSKWSSRAWMCHVGLEGARLGREWMLESRRRKEMLQRTPEGLGKNAIGEESGEKASGTIRPGKEETAALVTGAGEKESKVQRHELQRSQQHRWWRQAVVNGAFFPLTVHWSTDQGLLGDRWVGLLGMVAGEVTLRQAWRETA
ncbi:hypothetical protein MMC22_006098 [Lobaria immixta]|nr:hypothetical protein [Lobaria immixta]